MILAGLLAIDSRGAFSIWREYKKNCNLPLVTHYTQVNQFARQYNMAPKCEWYISLPKRKTVTGTRFSKRCPVSFLRNRSPNPASVTDCLQCQLAPVLPAPPSTAVNGMRGGGGEVSASCSGDGGEY